MTGRYHQGTVDYKRFCRPCFDVYWAPEGRVIATVEAADRSAAIHKAPKPYHNYLGEMYAKPVVDAHEKCNVDRDCPRHGPTCTK